MLRFLMGLLVLAWATAVAAAEPARPAPPPLSAYGDLPAVEAVALSPSGRRMAFVTVVGAQRVLMTTELSDNRPLAAFRVGDVKVRAVRFADEDRLLILTSVTAKPVSFHWRIPRDEWFQAHSRDLSTGRTVTLMSRTKDTLNTVNDMPIAVRAGGRTTVLVEGVTLVPPKARQDLYTLDLNTGGGRVVAEGTPGKWMSWVLDEAGAPLARSELSLEGGDWSLSVREKSGWRQVKLEATGGHAPRLVGLGRAGRTVVLSREVDGERQLAEFSLADGSAVPIEGAGEVEGLIFHPVTRRLAGFIGPDPGPDQVRIHDPEMKPVWEQVVRAFKGQRVRPADWSDDLSRLVVETQGGRTRAPTIWST